ncbi:MAG: SAM-dependent methyltransferase [Spirochaetales bacterium]|nr:SAM-dependent methyltransferase [Spirochaetales bacterium]
MDTENQQPYISDASQPNAGRIYDYLLGGSLNFEIDRIAGEQLKKLVPFAPKLAQLGRWFLGNGVRMSLERGFTQFIDFASGLPSKDHIHSNTPPGTKIMYSDIDPITVQYAKKIIGENPDVKYEFCDISKPETLLESDIVKKMFGDNHKVAAGYNGICYFLTDEQIRYSMNIIFKWADKGSILFFTDLDYDAQNINPTLQSVIDSYRKIKQPFFFRSKEKMKELIKPWKISDPGFLNLEEWHKMPSFYTEATAQLIGSGSGFYGGFLEK